MRRDLCESAKNGRLCPDDLCHGSPDDTLCGFDRSFYEEISDEYESEEYSTTAALAPAPKPAPPAEPPFQAICGVEPANGIVNHYIAVICYLPEDEFKNGDQVRVTVEPVRRAAERKPPR